VKNGMKGPSLFPGRDNHRVLFYILSLIAGGFPCFSLLTQEDRRFGLLLASSIV